MFKRVLLVLAFVAALGTAGFGVSTAQAQGCGSYGNYEWH